MPQSISDGGEGTHGAAMVGCLGHAPGSIHRQQSIATAPSSAASVHRAPRPLLRFAQAGMRLFGVVLACTLASQAQAEPFAYVANFASDSVSVIDVASHAVTDTLSVGAKPFGVATHPDGSRVYVVNSGSNSVSVISTSNNKVVASIPVGAGPRGVVVNAAGTKAYVSNFLGDSVSVIDTASNTVQATVAVGSQPLELSISATGDRVYVNNTNDTRVSVIDGSSNTVMNTDLGLPLAYGIAAHPRAGVVYVGSRNSNLIRVLDSTRYPMEEIKQLDLGATAIHMAVDPSGKQLYVAHFDNSRVSVLDVSDARNPVLSATVAVGRAPRGVAFHPDGGQAYVSNSSDKTVSVVDMQSHTVVATVGVGAIPFSPGNFITYTKLSLAELDLPAATLGQPYSQALSATGGKAPYAWRLEAAPSWMQIDPSSGLLSGTPDALASASAPLSFTVTVTDSSVPTPRTDSRTLSLSVVPAPLVNTTPALPAGKIGAPYRAALTASGGIGPYLWSVTGLPAGLSVSDGVLAGTPAEYGIFSLQVQVADGSEPPVTYSQSMDLEIAPADLAWGTTELPAATVGSPYRHTIVATGGSAPRIAVSGLPAGLHFDEATADISGTPSAYAPLPIPVTITVTDALVSSLTQTLDLVVQPAALRISLPSTVPVATVGQSYRLQLSATGGVAPYTWAAIGLPTGLHIDADGVVSGTPTNSKAALSAKAELTASITVTDSLGATSTQTLSLSVNDASVGAAVAVPVLGQLGGVLLNLLAMLMAALGWLRRRRSA